MASTDAQHKKGYATRMPPAERREQLLDVVLRVIVDQGVHKVSMETVAKEAGVTRPVVYGFFSDTNDLLRASLAREEAAATRQLAAVLDLDPQQPPVEVAVATLEGFLLAVLEAPDRWRAIFTLVDSSTKQFRARVEFGQDEAISMIEQLVTSATSSRADVHVDTQLMARTLFGVYWECGRLLLLNPDTYTIARLVAHGRQIFTRCLAPLS